jgi:putative transposase
MPWPTKNVMNQRTEFVLKAMQTDNFRALCREYQISPKVGYKWRERFLEQGLAGMGDESRRPHSSPGGLEEEKVCRMVLLKKRHLHWGPRKIREVYERQWGSAPSESSFKRVLERCGMTQKRVVRRVKETGRISSDRKAAAANEVWTVDFKGWWYDKEGRCDPLTVRDEFSRYVLELRALPDARTDTVKACFERLFERHGVPGAIRSDNGPPFSSAQGLLGLSRLSAWWLANGIDLERSRPGCPQDNGGHERMHRDIACELEGSAYPERQSALETWRKEFNEQRPHEALGMRPPAEIYTPSTKRWKGTPEEICYPGMAKRKVNATGGIHYGPESFFISQALAGWHLGLSPRSDGHLEVYFSLLLLGRLEPQTASFVPVTAAEMTEAMKS